MTRRGVTLVEMWVLIVGLMVLAPLVVPLGVEALRSARAPEAAWRLWSLDATVDDLRRDLALHPWRLDGEAVVVGGHPWSSHQGTLRLDGDPHRHDCRLTAEVDDAGWLRLVLHDDRHGERVLVAPPPEEEP